MAWRNQSILRSRHVAALACVVALIQTGCGAQSYKPKSNKAHATFVDNDSAPFTVPNNSGNGATTSSATASKGVPPYNFRVGSTGYTSTKVKVSNVKRVLRVSFTPGIQDEKVAGTGFSPQYGKLGVYISVNGLTQPTPMLSNGLDDGQASASNPMDFSGGLLVHCDAKDTSCKQDVTIEVIQPNYDYWCRNFQMGCPWVHVYETHPWHGTLRVQTDDTDSL